MKKRDRIIEGIEKLQKKTFFYQHNTLALACQRLKEVAMKEYNKPFLIVCDFINKIFKWDKKW